MGDSVVNQLLSYIDGVDALNNILIIGMTNRKDMLDEALLRPGRLEVHIEIGLPDEAGRVQVKALNSRRPLNVFTDRVWGLSLSLSLCLSICLPSLPCPFFPLSLFESLSRGEPCPILFSL